MAARGKRLRRVAATTVGYLLTLALVTAVMLFAVLSLAGPHGGLLPPVLHLPVLIIAWGAILALPLLVARRLWRRLG